MWRSCSTGADWLTEFGYTMAEAIEHSAPGLGGANNAGRPRDSTRMQEKPEEALIKREGMMRPATRFSPIDDDERSWDTDAYEAGYQARLDGASASMTATRSWRAGWADADAACASNSTHGEEHARDEF